MPVAEEQGLLPPSPVINVLSACNPTPTLNEARIYHLGRVADVRGLCVCVCVSVRWWRWEGSRGGEVEKESKWLETIYFFLPCA